MADAEVEAAQAEMFMYANELGRERRENARDDIVTALLDAEVDGDRLSEMDFNLFLHVGFGGGGPHHCLGANPARVEIRALFEELGRRIPKIEPTGEAQHLRSNFIGGIKHMPVRFAPGERESG